MGGGGGVDRGEGRGNYLKVYKWTGKERGYIIPTSIFLRCAQFTGWETGGGGVKIERENNSIGNKRRDAREGISERFQSIALLL